MQEHYGLQREKLSDGKYEPVNPTVSVARCCGLTGRHVAFVERSASIVKHDIGQVAAPFRPSYVCFTTLSCVAQF